MSDASYLLALLRYVYRVTIIFNVHSSTAVILAVTAVLYRFSSRSSSDNTRRELTQCSVQVAHIVPRLQISDTFTQTEVPRLSERGTMTDAETEPLRFCMETQTGTDPVDIEKMNSNCVPPVPTTPTTVDNTDLTYNEEERRFGLSTELPSFTRDEPLSSVNDDMDYILKSAIESALSDPTVSSNQQSLIPEVAYMDGDDEFDQFSIGIPATRSIESRKTSSIFHDSDVLFSNVTAWSPNVERYTTTDTMVSGGGIYRTLSEPVRLSPEWIPTENIAEPSNEQNGLIGELNSLEKSIEPSFKFESDVATQIAHIQQTVRLGLSSVLRISQNMADQVNVIPYGSIASGCATFDSSIDLVFIIPPEIMNLIATKTATRTISNTSVNDLPLNQVKEFETRLHMKQALTMVSEILTSNVSDEQMYSLVRITGVGSVSTNFSIVKVPTLTLDCVNGSMRFEIACNNLFPLFSTRLIKAYRGVGGDVLKEFILLVKYWAKCRGLLGNTSGKLCGFVWSLLAVFYCQSACLGLIPSLQALCTERQQWKDPFGSRRCDVGFVDDLSITGQGYLEGLDAGSLFVGFIDFYSNYWNWANGVVSVRLGKVVSIDSAEILLKQITSATAISANERFTRLHIEDPFDTKRDLGLCLNATTGAELRREFTNASLLIANGNSNIGHLFSETTPTVKSPRVARKYVMTNRRTESCQ